MDRVYVGVESDSLLYKKYAIDNNYYSHINNNRPEVMEVKSNELIRKIFGGGLTYAYLDTFCFDRIYNIISWVK